MWKWDTMRLWDTRYETLKITIAQGSVYGDIWGWWQGDSHIDCNKGEKWELVKKGLDREIQTHLTSSFPHSWPLTERVKCDYVRVSVLEQLPQSDVGKIRGNTVAKTVWPSSSESVTLFTQYVNNNPHRPLKLKVCHLTSQLLVHLSYNVSTEPAQWNKDDCTNAFI